MLWGRWGWCAVTSPTRCPAWRSRSRSFRPLTVVGLTAESGAWSEAWGALFLFGTNVASILTTGIIVMALFKVYATVKPAATSERRGVDPDSAVVEFIPRTVVNIGEDLVPD